MNRSAPLPSRPRHAHELAVPAPPPVVSPAPGCHCCQHWCRTFSTIGRCEIPAPDWHKGWTTSYAYICAEYRRRAAAGAGAAP